MWSMIKIQNFPGCLLSIFKSMPIMAACYNCSGTLTSHLWKNDILKNQLLIYALKVSYVKGYHI